MAMCLNKNSNEFISYKNDDIFVGINYEETLKHASKVEWIKAE